MKLSYRRHVGALSLLAAASLALAACGDTADGDEAGDAGGQSGTVEITDNHGTIEVPVNPERVVALDNTGAATLAAWDIELVAAPKNLFRVWPQYAENDEILDVGSHREPELESIVAAEADLIIGGGRFSSFYEDIKAITPTTIEISARDGQDHSAELKRQTEILGQIFDNEDGAQEIIDAFDQAVADAREAYNGEDTVIGLLTSGGQILYVAPVEGRSIGVLFPTLDLVPGIAVEAEDSTHGDDLSVEAIADANPDWLIVLDRDALFEEDGYVAAEELIEDSEALQLVTAVEQGQIVYLSGDFYLTEGIQAYTDLYRSVADAFSAAN